MKPTLIDPTLIDIRHPNNVDHISEEAYQLDRLIDATPKQDSFFSPVNLNDAKLLALTHKLKENKALRILDLTKSPTISTTSITALQKLQKTNLELVIIAPEANMDFQKADFLHPKIFIALTALKNYDQKKGTNRIHLFREQLTKFLKGKNELQWFINSCDTLKNKNLITTTEYDLLASREKTYLLQNKNLLIPKFIWGLFAKELQQDNFTDAKTNIKNLSRAFGFDYNLRDYIKNFMPSLEIFCGANTTFFMIDQDVYGCGDNRSGQLGCGDTEYVRTLTKISGIEGKIQKISCGKYHTFMITDQGVYGCGLNASGQLGCGDTEYVRTPTKISTRLRA